MKKRGPFAVFLFPSFGRFSTMRSNGLFAPYRRDADKGLDIALPRHYFPGDDPSKPPLNLWKAHGNLLYSNWLDYFVYQTTPYDLSASFPDGHSAEE